MKQPKWTARCKSGYIIDSTRKPCSVPTPRGHLMCAGCLEAEVIPQPNRTLWAAMLAVVLNIITM